MSKLVVASNTGPLVSAFQSPHQAALGGCPHPLADDLMRVGRRWPRRRDAKPREVTFWTQGRRSDGQERRCSETDLRAEAARGNPS
jgi:hypothetical protein